MCQDLAFREVPIFTGQGGQQRDGRSKGEQQEGSPPPDVGGAVAPFSFCATSEGKIHLKWVREQNTENWYSNSN